VHPIRFAVRMAGAAALTALIAFTLPSLSAAARAVGASAMPALDPADIDPTCTACDDFYAFATGGWRKTHTIPAGHASWGGFDELAQRNREALHAILEDAAQRADAPAGSDAQKLGAYYRSCMDTEGIEKAGTAPIDSLLRDVADTRSIASLAVEVAKLQTAGVNSGMEFASTPDTLDSSKTIAGIGMGGVGLPDRDYYLKDDERTAKIRAAYREYVATQLRNLGDDAPTAAAESDAIVELETALAKATPTRVELHDPKATYHPTKLADLPALGAHVPWRAFFAQAGAPPFEIVDVGIPPYVTAYDAQLAQRPVAT
jgi:putative endopeptidase